MTRSLVIAVLLGLVVGTAHADNITVGLFAPSAPFPSTSSRVDLATRLGEHLGKALGGAGIGRNYARADDFGAAVRKGDIQLALVDAPYLAKASGRYTVIAAAVRGGETSHAWQLVARSGARLSRLKGKHVLVPGIGGRETDFVLNVLLGGEVGRDFFGKIEAAPDTASTLAALGLGKADAAIVPIGAELPAGMVAVLTLRSVPGLVLIAYGTLLVQQRTALAAAAASFRGDAIVSGFKRGDDEDVKSVARRFSVPVKRGPLAVPAVRLVVGDLVENRTFAIARTPVTAFAIAPVTR